MISSKDHELFEYYNERAPEYEAFYWGDFPAVIPDPDRYKNDTLAIRQLLPDHVSGSCIDIACGTGFWLPVYEKNCTDITLIDQSDGVLNECRKKIDEIDIGDKTSIICDEIFDYPYQAGRYDSAVIGFLISHLTDAEMEGFFNIIRRILKPGGRFAVIDSLWSEDLTAIGRKRSGMIERSLFDGRTFTIYKRFFERPELNELAGNSGIDLEIIYWGKVFFFAVGRFIGTR